MREGEGRTGRYEEMVNEFLYRSTVRTAMIHREIADLKADKPPSDSRYVDMCHMVLRHADDVRLAIACVDALSIAGEKKEELKAMLKMISIEAMVYQMGQALLKMKGLANTSKINTCFIRRTKKFWIHPDNVETVFAIIMRHLPVYVFGDDGSGKISSAISSVYFDTPDFYLYQRRIRREQKAHALRIRKYGESSIIAYVELKTHEEGWTGDRSTKRRFLIHARSIPTFAQGTDIWEEIKSINSSDAHDLYLEILSLIRTHGLIPIVKTAYLRTAFQFPGDTSVRLSIDTNLTVWNGPCGKAFPYAILEIKQEEGNEIDWVRQLSESPLVECVEKFSKYLHGCAVHYDSVPSIPYWYNQICTLSKRPVERISSPEFVSHPEKFEPLNQNLQTLLGNLRLESRKCDETNFHLQGDLPTNTLGNSFPSPAQDMTFRPCDGHLQQIPQPRPPVEPLSGFFSSAPLSKPQERAVPAVPSEKQIVLPVRIEPKVFFANERTFLSWLHFAIFVGGIGAALMGLGDRKAALSGLCFIIVSVIFSVYALYLYIWRAKKINEKSPGPYDDYNGPVVLVAVFLSAMATSVFFKFPLK